MKFAIIALLVFGLAFAGQIVNVGQAIGGTSDSVKGTPPADDSQCYNLHVQCLRNGCAAAAGTFNEETQGCDGGSTAEFASAVGQCSKAQGECVMGTGSGYSNMPGAGAGTPPADDSGCYNLHVQCLRNGCAAAGGAFNEETQGCDGGSTAEFASAVGQCSKAQGECIMGTGSGYSNLSGSGAAAAVPAETTAGSGAIVPISAKTGAGGTSQTQGGLCPLGFALALLLAAAYVSTEE